jgi:ankyrin repeat protein
MSQHFINLIRQGSTAEIAAAVEADPSVATARDAQGVSALMWAVYTRQNVIRDFLVSGLEELDIFEAAAVGDCERLLVLLHGNATLVRTVSPDGWPPLHLAAAFGTPEAVTLLLEHGAHVHEISRNATRNQALNACVSLGDSVEIARRLIECGADVNYVQAGGYTPLHQAGAAGKSEMVELLLRNHARRDARCDQGKTPEDYARERNHAVVVAMLRTAPEASTDA